MSTLARPECETVWELRGIWARAGTVRLTLAEGCVLRTIVGRIDHVAVTGAFVVVDGWHIPLHVVLAVGKPTRQDRDEYRRALRGLDQEGH
jgi:hypothetical protein